MSDLFFLPLNVKSSEKQSKIHLSKNSCPGKQRSKIYCIMCCRLTSTTRPSKTFRRTSHNQRSRVSIRRRAKSTPWWRRTATRASSPQISTWAWPRGKRLLPWPGEGLDLLFSVTARITRQPGCSDSTAISIIVSTIVSCASFMLSALLDLRRTVFSPGASKMNCA